MPSYNLCPGSREKPCHAAARECNEETLGVLGSASDLAAALKDFEENNVFKVCSNPNTCHFQIQYCEVVRYQCKHTSPAFHGLVQYGY